MAGLTSAEIEGVFDGLFERSHRTRLVGGGDEPLYVPPTGDRLGRIVYRADYPASALHEVAHWCVAGAARRDLEDYGYWYAPDGRTEQQQGEFERVEVAPQALESVLADAAGVRFVPSADNVEAGVGPSVGFLSALAQRKEDLLAGALRGRALRMQIALALERAKKG